MGLHILCVMIMTKKEQRQIIIHIPFIRLNSDWADFIFQQQFKNCDSEIGKKIIINRLNIKIFCSA